MMGKHVGAALACAAAAVFWAWDGAAQPAEPQVSAKDDPSRPYPGFMKLYAQTRGFSLGRASAVKVSPDGATVLFLRAPPGKAVLELHELNVSTGEARQLLTPDTVLKGAEEQLSVEEKARRERMRITVGGFTSYGLSPDGGTVLLQLSGKLYTFVRATGAVKELPVPAGVVLDPQFSPDGTQVSYVRDRELCVLDLRSLKERVLTRGSTELVSNGDAEFVAQEEMNRFHGYWWSPDSKALAYQQTDTTPLELFHIQDPRHPENTPVAFRYPRAGKANALVKVGVIPAAGGKTTWLSWDAEKFPYLARVVWAPNAPLSLLVQNRQQTEQRVLTADPRTGVTSVLMTEVDDAWLNLPNGDWPRWLPDGSAFLWMTERNGAWELELRGKDGQPMRTVVPFTMNLRELSAVDAAGKAVMVLAGADPTSNELWRVPLEAGGAPVRVSKEEGVRTVQFSENASTYVETLGSRSAFRVVRVFSADGTQKALMPAATQVPPFQPNVTWMKVGEGAGLHAVVVRPRAFDARKRYPVVVSVYGGPHHNMVTSALDAYLREQWMADHGFIVVAVDGRGTQWRGRAWERAIKGQFGSVPLADQVSGLKLLGAQVPQMDLSRVGILGWSFGGYMSALAVLRRGDVFHTAVAGAPVVEWDDYDTHYTERYLGLPQTAAAAYTDGSLLKYARDLNRPLLLIHGTADDNVYFFHTLKLSDALTRAGRDHTVLPLAGFTHLVPEPAMTEALWNRMVSHLSATLRP